MSASIQEHFSPLEDPRIDRNKLHELMDILILLVCAVSDGAAGCEAIEEFGREKLDWLRKFAPFANGVPSHDCIANVVSRLSPKGFQACFRSWTEAVSEITEGEVIAVDGKTARGSRDRKRLRKALHMVSAWASANRLVLAQEATEEKSNEITAIPKLLELLELKGCIVTIDAMGCQRDIAAQIVDQGGDYVLGLKGNQSTLHESVEDFFEVAMDGDFAGVEYDSTEEGQTRITDAWKCVATGSRRICARCPRPTFGRDCAASAWSNATARSTTRRRSSGATTSTPSAPRPNASRMRYASIGAWKTGCIGVSMSSSARTPAGSARATPQRS